MRTTPAPRNATLWLASLLALALIGCGGGNSSDTSATNTLSGPDPTTLSLSAVTPSGLSFTLAQDKATVPVSSTINYTLTLVNSSAAPVSFQTADQAGTNTPLVPASVTLADASGASLYTLPAPDQTITVTLQPGDSLTQNLSLTNIIVKAGRYQATATFQTSPPSTFLGPLVVTAR